MRQKSGTGKAPAERVRTLATTPPIPYRQQNGGDYLIPTMQLRPGLGHPGAEGFKLHVKSDDAEVKELRPSRRYAAGIGTAS